MQQQVLKEVYSTASSLGLTDPKLLGKMLSLCANPATVLERNVGFPLLGRYMRNRIMNRTTRTTSNYDSY